MITTKLTCCAIARETGFSIDKVNWNRPARVVVSDFLNACGGQSLGVVATTFSQLAEEYGGSPILRAYANVLAQAAQAAPEYPGIDCAGAIPLLGLGHS